MGQHGIEFDSDSNRYTFYVRTYFEEFKRAVDNYIANLESEKEDVTLLNQALANRPGLL